MEDEVGYLPSLSVRHDAMAALDAAERKRFFYLEAYHTVFVMGLLCAALLARGYADGRSEAREDAPAAPDIARTHRDPVPQWEGRYARLPGTARDRCFPLVLSVELKRALATGDVRALRDLLGVALESGQAHLPTVEQGLAILEMMNRSAVPRPSLAA